MMRAWILTASVVLGATAGWAAYFAWEYRDFIAGQEIAAGAVGAAVGLAIGSVVVKTIR